MYMYMCVYIFKPHSIPRVPYMKTFGNSRLPSCQGPMGAELFEARPCLQVSSVENFAPLQVTASPRPPFPRENRCCGFTGSGRSFTVER